MWIRISSANADTHPSHLRYSVMHACPPTRQPCRGSTLPETMMTCLRELRHTCEHVVVSAGGNTAECSTWTSWNPAVMMRWSSSSAAALDGAQMRMRGFGATFGKLHSAHIAVQAHLKAPRLAVIATEISCDHQPLQVRGSASASEWKDTHLRSRASRRLS